MATGLPPWAKVWAKASPVTHCPSPSGRSETSKGQPPLTQLCREVSCARVGAPPCLLARLLRAPYW